MSKYFRRKDIDKYIYPCAVNLNHRKFFSNTNPDLSKNNVGSTDRAKK